MRTCPYTAHNLVHMPRDAPAAAILAYYIINNSTPQTLQTLIRNLVLPWELLELIVVPVSSILHYAEDKYLSLPVL